MDPAVTKLPEDAHEAIPELLQLARMSSRISPGLDSPFKHQLHPADCIPEIIKSLPPPLPDDATREIVLSAWPFAGHLRIILAVRRNALPDTHTWYWALESSEQIPVAASSLAVPWDQALSEDGRDTQEDSIDAY